MNGSWQGRKGGTREKKSDGNFDTHGLFFIGSSSINVKILREVNGTL